MRLKVKHIVEILQKDCGLYFQSSDPGLLQLKTDRKGVACFYDYQGKKIHIKKIYLEDSLFGYFYKK